LGSAGSRLSSGGLDLILTGIPRSGTSYLCNLLHRYDNCVILNEPAEVAPALDGSILPWLPALFYRQIRRDVLMGVPIRNKLIDGKVTQDTAVGGEQKFYVPAVSSGDFVLGMKTTIPFLSRLPHLRRVMPSARLVACVRNPFDTIASWKTTFPHLRDADVEGVRIGNPRDLVLSAAQRTELERISAVPEPAMRRAAWWRYLAELVLESIEQVALVRYEQLVAQPRQTLETILAGGNAGRPVEPIAPSEPASKLEALDAADVQAIRSLCSDAAIRLGVYRPGP
jgi:Sulfotransferase family